MGNASYANFDVVSALVENISRSDEYASITLGGLSYNSDRVGGKELTDTSLYTVDDFSTEAEASAYEKEFFSGMAAIWLTVLVMAMPVAVLGAGIAVCIRRRFR